MGNKINPNTFRYVINNNWCLKSHLINYYNINIYEKIKKYINKNIGKFNYDELYMEILEKCIILTIYTAKPGNIIGSSGLFINKLKKYIFNKYNLISYINIKESYILNNFSFLFSNLFIKIFKRENYKKFIRDYLKKILNKLILGIKIIISGRINGSEIARKEIFKKGKMPLQTYSKNIFYKMESFNTKYGIISIKIWFFYNEFKKIFKI